MWENKKTTVKTGIAVIHKHKWFSDIIVPIGSEYMHPTSNQKVILSEEEAIFEAGRIRFNGWARWIEFEKTVKRTVTIQDEEIVSW